MSAESDALFERVGEAAVGAYGKAFGPCGDADYHGGCQAIGRAALKALMATDPSSGCGPCRFCYSDDWGGHCVLGLMDADREGDTWPNLPGPSCPMHKEKS